MLVNSDEGQDSLKGGDTHESVSVGKEVVKHLEKDLFGSERKVKEDEEPSIFALSRTGDRESQPMFGETKDDIREDCIADE